jgi:DNA-binding response OmpR family regulator
MAKLTRKEAADLRLSNMRALVVEDEPTISLELSAILEGLGVHVMETDTVAEAVELLRDETFDLIVADFRLADGNSDLLLESVRALYPDLPMLIVTGLSPSDQTVDLSGKVLWLSKPFSLEAVRDAVTYLLNRT